MGNADMKAFIGAAMLLHLFVFTSQMSIDVQNPWDQLKMKQFCMPSTYYTEIKGDGCAPEMVTVNACLGVCPSYVGIIWQEPYFKNFCQCCGATETETVQFTLKNCKNSEKRVVAVQSAKKCSCLKSICS